MVLQDKKERKRDSKGRFVKVPYVDTRNTYIKKAQTNTIDNKYGIETRLKGKYTSSGEFDAYRYKHRETVPTGEVYKRGNKAKGIVKGQPKMKTITVYTPWMKVEVKEPNEKKKDRDYNKYRVTEIIPESTGEVYKRSNKKKGIVKGQLKIKYHRRKTKWTSIESAEKGQPVDYNELKKTLYLRSLKENKDAKIIPTHTVSQEDINMPIPKKYVYLISGKGYYETPEDRERGTTVSNIESDRLETRTIRVVSDEPKSYEELFNRFMDTRTGGVKTKSYIIDGDSFKVSMAFEVV